MRFLALSVTVLGLFGCAGEVVDRENEELEILVAAFRHALTDAPNPVSRVYFLLFRRGPDDEWIDPPDELFPRLTGLQLSWKFGSRFGGGSRIVTWKIEARKASEIKTYIV